ncbi:MAG: RNA helicase, partial [Acidimicrobiia bacterium]
PTQELAVRWSDIKTLWKDLTERERDLRLSPTRRPDPGFGNLAYLWAGEMAFDDLPTHGMAPGDFVRVSRQLADLLRQIREGVSELRGEATIALISVDRGVVAAQGVG